MQELIQNQTNKLSVLLTTAGGLPATGLTFSDCTAQFSKNGGAFAAKTLTGLNFLEVGYGYYTIEFDASECNTLGQFVVVVFNADLVPNPTSTAAQVVVTPSASNSASVPTCNVIGHLLDLQGNPIVDAAVNARIIGQPTLVNTGVVGVGLGDDVVSAKTDANGFFSLQLARLVMVDITIAEINYRRTLTVPNLATAELFTQVP